MRKRGIRKRVTGGKINETFEIKTDEFGNKVVTGRRNFVDKRKKMQKVKEEGGK